MQPRNLAARAGRWSATHRKTAVIGWILFVVLATVIGGKVGQKNLEPSAMGNGESKRGDMIVADAGFPETIGERVLIQGKGSIESGDPEVTAAVEDTVTRLDKIEGVSDIESPLDERHRAETVSKDGRSVVVNFTLPGKYENAADGQKLEKTAEAPLAAVAAVQKAHPGAARRGVRRRVRAEGARRHGARRRGEVHAVLDGRHPADPAARLRRGRRRRRAAAARRLLVRGHHGPARAGQPAEPAPRGRRPGHDAHRPRRRRRLRDVLPAPDDGRAGQGRARPPPRSTSPPPPPAARC